MCLHLLVQFDDQIPTGLNRTREQFEFSVGQIHSHFIGVSSVRSRAGKHQGKGCSKPGSHFIDRLFQLLEDRQQEDVPDRLLLALHSLESLDLDRRSRDDSHPYSHPDWLHLSAREERHTGEMRHQRSTIQAVPCLGTAQGEEHQRRDQCLLIGRIEIEREKISREKGGGREAEKRCENTNQRVWKTDSSE